MKYNIKADILSTVYVLNRLGKYNVVLACKVVNIIIREDGIHYCVKPLKVVYSKIKQGGMVKGNTSKDFYVQNYMFKNKCVNTGKFDKLNNMTMFTTKYDCTEYMKEKGLR